MSEEDNVTMKVKWVVVASTVAAVAAVAVAVNFWDPAIGASLFKVADLTQSEAQTAPAGRQAPIQLAQKTDKQPAAAANVPHRTETINYGSWIVTCTDTVERSSKKVCSGVLQVIEQKQRRVLLAWVIGRDPKGVLRTVMQTPTGVEIGKGVELKLGKSPVRTLAYTVCEPQRCQASIVMDDAMVKDALASSDAVVSIVADNGRGINFNIKIEGIDKVLADLRR